MSSLIPPRCQYTSAGSIERLYGAKQCFPLIPGILGSHLVGGDAPRVHSHACAGRVEVAGTDRSRASVAAGGGGREQCLRQGGSVHKARL